MNPAEFHHWWEMEERLEYDERRMVQESTLEVVEELDNREASNPSSNL